jgi:hypothetical protein
MSRRPVRLLARTGCLLSGLVVPVLLGALGSPALDSPAVAAPISHCTTTTGVIVAVDLRPFGGSIDRGCGPTPTTGYDALHNAGFTTAGDDTDGPAFVCRIDNRPDPAQQSCATTPSASASWSYWYADVGHRSWSYAELGAMSMHPAPGSVEAWVFGSTSGGANSGEPTFSPASVRATNLSPRPTPTPTATSDGVPSPGVSHSVVPGGSSGASATPTPSPSGTASAHRHRHPHPTGTAADSVGPTPSIVDVSPAAATSVGSAGSPTGVLVGVGVVVALSAVGGVTAWRRRRNTP